MTELTDYARITELLSRHGFRFSKTLGQNFLTAAWVPERIAHEAELTSADGVLEIGPGVGCLTAELARRAGRVCALELDRRLESVLAETLGGFDNISVVFADAVKADLRTICTRELGDRPWKVCANLPYNVTSPLINVMLKAKCFESITVMVQKEVAQRMCAVPGSGEYGAFSVLVQWYARPRVLFDVPPNCFTPRPKVTSAVVRLETREEPPVPVGDEDFFFAVVRSAFNQRRKTLPNALSAGLKNMDRPAAAAALAEMGLPAAVRGEALSLEQFAALSDRLRSAIRKESGCISPDERV